MSEEATAQEATAEADAHWTTGNEEFAADEVVSKAVSKFDSPYKLGKSYAELEKKLGSEFRIPDDVSKLSDEQKEALNARVKELSGAPKSIEDYQLDIPEEMVSLIDQDAVQAIKETALEKGATQDQLNAITKTYMDNLAAAYNKQVEARNEALDAYKKELGSKASEVLGTVDSAGKTVELGNVQKAAMQLSKELGLDYVDSDGKPKSKLWDELEMTRLGDKVSLCKVFDWIYKEKFAEGAPTPSAGTAQESESFFDYPSMN